jgi:hypothetical protein
METEYRVNLAICYGNGTWDQVEEIIYIENSSEERNSEGEIWEAASDQYKVTHASSEPVVAIGMIDFELINDEDNFPNIDDGEPDYTIEGDDEDGEQDWQIDDKENKE